MTLPTALQPFAAYRQFITYTLRPSVSRPGKFDKLPTDWRTGHVADAHDPAIWTDYESAAQAGAVGFVFTDNDPFWFLDIDSCNQGGAWSALALELCQLFAGAAVEVSVSGTGLHIFGVGQVPRHSTKNSALGLELYHNKRFVALGTGAQGNAMTDHTAALAGVVDRFFALGADAGAPESAWTYTPVAAWRGPEDDDELIRRACNSKSAAGAFGARASFAQLWDADFPALCKAFPDTVRGYDASSADAALAQHLAFWTGKNCERVAVLMRKSNLVRPKWTEHASYIERTVLQAVTQQVDVCQDKPLEDAKPVTGMRDVVGETWLQPDDMKIMFSGCTYVAASNTILMPGGHNYNEARFNAMLGGFTFTLDRNQGKAAKTAWEAFCYSRDVRFPKAHACEFDPKREAGAVWQEGNLTFVNSYAPIKVASKKGNPRPFLDHLAKIMPLQYDRDIILAYMAAIVQHPGVKFQWAPLIQGAPGNGKTLLSRCVVEAVGRAHCHTPKAHQLTSRFNDWLVDRIFIAVEDIFVKDNQDEMMDILAPMITSDWQEVEGKGQNKSSRLVCANFIFNSNHKDGLIKKKDDRRYAIFFTEQQNAAHILRDGMGGAYFPDLYSWLKRDGYAIVTDYLTNYAIPDAMNPARDCHRAPETSSTSEAIFASVGRLEQEIFEMVDQDQIGFRNGWVSSHFLDKLVQAMGMETRYPRNKRPAILEELGYILHPGLRRGQVDNPVTPDGMKPRLYIKQGHHSQALRGSDVARQYEHDQTDAARHLRLASV